MNLNVQQVFFVFICLFCIIEISCVGASDINFVDEFNNGNHTISVDLENNIVSEVNEDYSNNNSNVLNQTEDNNFNFKKNDIKNSSVIESISKPEILPLTFKALEVEINKLKPSDVYTLNNDVVYKKSVDIYCYYIDINIDNITINGNGHTIDGKNFTAIFNINANNVKIFNLTISNSHQFALPKRSISYGNHVGQAWAYMPVDSPVCWHGDNGILSDCTFVKNSADNGGAVSWKGNNGLINNCNFINNTAYGVGGAIFVGGQNNTIFNVNITNSYSTLSGESIFLDRKSKNTNISNVYGNDNYCINATVFNDFDVDYLYYSALQTTIGINGVDLIKAIYQSLVFKRHYISNNNFTFFGVTNATDYSLAFTKKFGYDVIFIENYYFKNVTCPDDIFDSILCANYDVDYSLIKNMNVVTAGGITGPAIGSVFKKTYTYEEALSMTAGSAFYPCLEYLRINDPGLYNFLSTVVKNGGTQSNVKTILNVTFHSTMSIFSRSTWLPHGFNTISINGANSTIHAETSDDDEYTWAKISDNVVFVVSNLTISRFNTAVENKGGFCVFNHVIFSENKMDYMFTRDWGAAILNSGVCICNDCGFYGNYAKNGGAIFNQGMLILQDCSFGGNLAYGVGDNICVGKVGTVVINGEQITSDTNIVKFAKSLDSKDVRTLAIISIVASGAIGLVAGFFGGPWIGMLAGAAAGALIGYLMTKYVVEHTYDAYYDRFSTAVLFIGGSATAGILGGVIGGAIHYYCSLNQIETCRSLSGSSDWSELDYNCNPPHRWE